MSNGTEKEIIFDSLKTAREIVEEWGDFVSKQEKMKFREHLYQIMKQADEY